VVVLLLADRITEAGTEEDGAETREVREFEITSDCSADGAQF
jgi:hypothetical protein